MEYKFYYRDDGINVFEVPELVGKKVELKTDLELFWDIVGKPDVPEPTEEEIKERMEDDDCDREEAIESLKEDAKEDQETNAPAIRIEVAEDDDGIFEWFEVTLECGVDTCRGGSDYEEFTKEEAKKVFDYICSIIKA